MNEEVLKRFFLGEAGAKELAADLSGSVVERQGVTNHPITDMRGDFEVRPEHLIRICDAVLGGEIEAKYLQEVGFCILASDHFEYDTDTREGDLIGETVFDWSAPEVNYPLTIENVRRFRERLVRGRDPFAGKGAG